MSALGMIVGGWAVFFGIVAPTPPQDATTGDMGTLSNTALETNVPPLEAPRIEDNSTPDHAVEYLAVVSSYSCDAVPANPMWPCGLFRDGTRPHAGLHGLVAACPLEWLGRVVTVEGWGALYCRDTPRTGWYGNQPHIDVFTSYPAAIRWGIQERTVYLE